MKDEGGRMKTATVMRPPSSFLLPLCRVLRHLLGSEHCCKTKRLRNIPKTLGTLVAKICTHTSSPTNAAKDSTPPVGGVAAGGVSCLVVLEPHASRVPASFLTRLRNYNVVLPAPEVPRAMFQIPV